MSFIHNRTGALVFVAALAVLLLGAGCQKQSGPSEPAAPINADAQPKPADATTESEIRWAEYRSEKLGITIPYPEGWYVEENEYATTGEQIVIFYSTPTPSVVTERPLEAWMSRANGTVADAMRGLDVRSDTTVERSGVSMRRIVFFEDFYAQPEVVLYLWERNGQTYEIGGPNVEVVERMINAFVYR
ncbi:hypothetical protein HY635_04385 [Candidatus Uhrbacteria bacterium]|nr:hypothetical protein [Candidatus Uhrbacteria bacterium]